MESEISATEAARDFGGILQRVRSHGESFVVTDNGEAVCRIGPVEVVPPSVGPKRFTAAELADLVERLPRPDPGFADDVEAAIASQPLEVPKSPWD